MTEERNDSGITIDKSSFVYKQGVKICRVTSNGTLLFHDKDKRRSAERGTNQIEVYPTELLSITNAKNAGLTPPEQPKVDNSKD